MVVALYTISPAFPGRRDVYIVFNKTIRTCEVELCIVNTLGGVWFSGGGFVLDKFQKILKML